MDFFHNGTILTSSLDQAFSSTGIQFSKNERDELAKAFTVTEMPERFNYFLLKKEIENPENSMDDGGKVPLGFGQDEECQRIVHRLVDTLRVRRYTFKDEFRKKLNTTGLFVSTNDEKLLFKKYKINNKGDIDYRHFIADSENLRLFF